MLLVVGVCLVVTGAAVGVRLQRWAVAAPYRRAGDVVRRHHSPAWVAPASVTLPALLWWAVAPTRPHLGLLVAVACWWLAALAVVDLDVHRLPDRLQLPAYPVLALALAAADLTTGDGAALLRSGLATVLVLAVGGLLWATAPRRGLGLGDVKLAALLAALLAQLGWSQVLLGLWLGLALGGLVALGLVLTRRAGRHDHLALGPPLILGTLVTLAAG